MHYLHVAKNGVRLYIDCKEVPVKKYLHIVRALLCAEWVHKYNTQPPTFYHLLVDALHPKTPLFARIRQLVRQKQDMNESDVVKPVRIINDWITRSIARIENSVFNKKPLPDWTLYDAAFRRVVHVHSTWL